MLRTNCSDGAAGAPETHPPEAAGPAEQARAEQGLWDWFSKAGRRQRWEDPPYPHQSLALPHSPTWRFYLKSSARTAGQPCAPRRAHAPRLHCCRELSEKQPLCSHVEHFAGAWAPTS